jgi:hypothetical protein
MGVHDVVGGGDVHHLPGTEREQRLSLALIGEERDLLPEGHPLLLSQGQERPFPTAGSNLVPVHHQGDTLP